LLLWTTLTVAQTPQPTSLESGATAKMESPYTQIHEFVRLKQWKELAVLTEELHRKNSTDPTALYWLGISRLKLHEPIGAVQAFRSAEKLGLQTALSHEGLGLAYYDLNQFWLFEEQMKKAASLDPRDPTPDYYLGLYRWTIRADV